MTLKQRMPKGENDFGKSRNSASITDNVFRTPCLNVT